MNCLMFVNLISEKMTRTSFVGKDEYTSDLDSHMHIDVCGPILINAKINISYFITFTDGYIF